MSWTVIGNIFLSCGNSVLLVVAAEDMHNMWCGVCCQANIVEPLLKLLYISH